MENCKSFRGFNYIYIYIYIDNHFSHFFIISHQSHHLTKLSKLSLTLSISLFSTFFLFLVSFFFFFSFPSPFYIFCILIFFFSFSFFFFFFFYLSLIMASDFGFAIFVVILDRFFHYMDDDFRALHWLLLLLLLLLQHLVLLADPSTDPLSLSLLVCPCVGVFGFVVSVVDFGFIFYFCGWFLILCLWECVCVCVYQRKKNMMRAMVLQMEKREKKMSEIRNY